MANPQIENGYTKIANELLEALARTRFAGQERQIIDVVIRRTYGFRQRAADITLSEFVAATGIRKARCCSIVSDLIDRHVLSAVVNGDGVRRLSIQKDYSRWITESATKRCNRNNINELHSEPFQNSEMPVSENCNRSNINGLADEPFQISEMPVSENCNDSFQISEIIVSENCNAPITAIKKNKENKKKYIYFYVDFETLWKRYPLKDGKAEAEKAFRESVCSEDDLTSITQALTNYLAHLSANPWKSPKTGKSWFQNWRDWVDHREISAEDERRKEALLRELQDDIAGLYRSLVGVAPEREQQRRKAIRTKERIVDLLSADVWSVQSYDEFVSLTSELRLLRGDDPRRSDLRARIDNLFSAKK